jgi:hypothetical protein
VILSPGTGGTGARALVAAKPRQKPHRQLRLRHSQPRPASDTAKPLSMAALMSSQPLPMDHHAGQPTPMDHHASQTAPEASPSMAWPPSTANLDTPSLRHSQASPWPLSGAVSRSPMDHHAGQLRLRHSQGRPHGRSHEQSAAPDGSPRRPAPPQTQPTSAPSGGSLSSSAGTKETN